MQGLLFETPNNIDYARDIIKKTIVNDPRPISIAYSGGKDSTLLLQLTLEARDLAESDKQIYVAFSNTGYECDGKLERIQSVFERLKDIPNLSAKIVSPPPEYSILVSIIGLGYPAPCWRIRYCTHWIKKKPGNAFDKELALKHDGLIRFTGCRKNESSSRLARLTKAGAPEAYVLIRKGLKIDELSPIANVSTKELWEYLRRLKTFYWGEELEELEALYKNGNETQRDGCWICTVCSERKKFFLTNEWQSKVRQFIRKLNDDREKRSLCETENQRSRYAQGYASGRFTMEARKEILDYVTKIEQEYNVKILSDKEREIISLIWGGTILHTVISTWIREQGYKD